MIVGRAPQQDEVLRLTDTLLNGPPRRPPAMARTEAQRQ
jgi:hypothetical protein